MTASTCKDYMSKPASICFFYCVHDTDPVFKIPSKHFNLIKPLFIALNGKVAQFGGSFKY